MDDKHTSPFSSTTAALLNDTVQRSGHVLARQPLPYNGKRKSQDTVLILLSRYDVEKYKNHPSKVIASLAMKRKRFPSDEPDTNSARLGKRYTGDVGAVVNHYNSRPDVSVTQRLESPIMALKAFNNWITSVLISLFADPALEKSAVVRSNGVQGFKQGKVLDMGCGKGGDIPKWARSRAAEVCFADIAEVSLGHARGRWQSIKAPKFDASFAALDCFTEPLSHGFPSDKLNVPFDVVSMQFCMHYAFETAEKARCMLRNVSKYLRSGGVFIGTIPNSELLLKQLDMIPREATEKSFGNEIYKIAFQDSDERPIYGHRYLFYLQDAVDNVPEYVVRWDNFVQLASEYGLCPIYREDFHTVFAQNKDDPELRQLLVQMKAVDSHGVSAMDNVQWQVANIYFAFAFEKL